MNNHLMTYFENTKKPWSILFYRVVWEQLSHIVDSKVLDFGSGLGITANHFARNNDLVAIEPNSELVKMRVHENSYQQIIGDIKELRKQKDNSVDVVVCHNVLEYVKDRTDILREFYRVLKPNGMLSIIKHNHAGRIMQKVVYENNLDEAMILLDGGQAEAAYFGKVNSYDLGDINQWISGLALHVERVLGVRTFFALHANNEIKYDSSWQETMLELEIRVSCIKDFVNIAFFNHVILSKTDFAI